MGSNPKPCQRIEFATATGHLQPKILPTSPTQNLANVTDPKSCQRIELPLPLVISNPKSCQRHWPSPTQNLAISCCLLAPEILPSHGVATATGHLQPNISSPPQKRKKKQKQITQTKKKKQNK